MAITNKLSPVIIILFIYLCNSCRMINYWIRKNADFPDAMLVFQPLGAVEPCRRVPATPSAHSRPPSANRWPPPRCRVMHGSNPGVSGVIMTPIHPDDMVVIGDFRSPGGSGPDRAGPTPSPKVVVTCSDPRVTCCDTPGVLTCSSAGSAACCRPWVMTCWRPRLTLIRSTDEEGGRWAGDGVLSGPTIRRTRRRSCLRRTAQLENSSDRTFWPGKDGDCDATLTTGCDVSTSGRCTTVSYCDVSRSGSIRQQKSRLQLSPMVVAALMLWTWVGVVAGNGFCDPLLCLCDARAANCSYRGFLTVPTGLPSKLLTLGREIFG